MSPNLSLTANQDKITENFHSITSHLAVTVTVAKTILDFASIRVTDRHTVGALECSLCMGLFTILSMQARYLKLILFVPTHNNGCQKYDNNEKEDKDTCFCDGRIFCRLFIMKNEWCVLLQKKILYLHVLFDVIHTINITVTF